MASARHRRDDVTTDSVFEIELSDALTRLLPANQVQATDEWFFSISGTTLRITRARRASTPIEE